MKKNIFYGIMLAVAFLLSGASFASPYTSDSGYMQPDSTAFVLAVWPPTVSAVIKSDSFDTVTAMATSGDANSDDKYCMAGCRIDERWQILAGFYQKNVDLDRTVIACGFESTPIEVPTKIPVTV